jgi:cellulose synthase/poly-beta-1,6-N-acetylglucosamine synthase-like glycosyltransferase
MLPDIGPAGLWLSYALSFLALFSGFYLLFIILENHKKYASPKTKSLPSVSIIIPAYNGSKYIKDCINSVLALDYPKEKLEVIVIDDGSLDRTFKTAKSFKGISVYRKKHEGKSAAVNLGIKKARGEFIGILDVDSSVSKDSLLKMLGYFEDLKVGAVHSGIRAKNNKNLIERFQEVEYLLSLFLKKNLSIVDALYVTPGVFSVYRADVFKKIGGFDTEELSEDLEIALRMISKNYTIKCASDAITYTMVPSTFRELEKQRVRWNSGLIKNMQRYSFLVSRKYGELGYMVLPFMIIGNIALTVFFSFVLLNFILQSINTAYLLSMTGIEVFFRNLLILSFPYGLVQSPIFFYLAITVALGLFFLYSSKRYCLFEKGSGSIPDYAIYLFTSGYIYFYLWLMTFYRISKKDITW